MQLFKATQESCLVKVLDLTLFQSKMSVYNLLTCALQKCRCHVIPVVLTFYFRYFEKGY